MKKRIISLALTLMLAVAAFGMFMTPTVTSAQASSFNTTKYQSTIEIMAMGGTPIGGITEQINYSRRDVDEFILSPTTPNYTNYNCGVSAGGVTVAYYNKELTGLIPNHTAGRYIGSTWSWTGQTASGSLINDLLTELNTRMGGGGASGVTIQQYLSGIASYVGSKGYSMGLEDVRESNNSLTSSFKTVIENGGLVALFLDSFNIADSVGIYQYNDYDIVSLTQYAGAHIMVACGYKEITYYDAQDAILRKDTYVRVSTGLDGLGWIRINTHCNLDAAWRTQIV